MTGTAPAGHDEFVFHGGRRRSLRFWLVALPILLVVAVVALAGAINKGTSDDSGGVGHVAIPFVVAVVSILGVVVTLSQWWEDATYFRFDGAGVAIGHGGGRLRGRTITFDRALPVTVTTEQSGSNSAIFISQGDVRERLGEVSAVGPLQQSNLESWLRTRGFSIEHR